MGMPAGERQCLAFHRPPNPPVLEYGEVHLWRARLETGAGRMRGFYEALSPDEQARAERFRFQRHRDRFVVAHGLLRDILARYLGTDPKRLHFRYGPQGKPALTRDCGGDFLQFNLSHSQGTALYALACGREVGVDLERIRPDWVDDQVAERLFSLQEVAILRRLPQRERQEAFVRCWTRKEARVKACGRGITTHPEPDDQATTGCVLWELALDPDLVAAVAVEGGDFRLKCWRWSE